MGDKCVCGHQDYEHANVGTLYNPCRRCGCTEFESVNIDFGSGDDHTANRP